MSPIPHAIRDHFTASFQPHLDAAYRTALSLTKNTADAEDLVQETYLKAYQALVERPGTAIRNPKTWLLTVLRRLFIDRYRMLKRAPELEELSAETVATEEATPEQEFWIHYTHEALHDAMHELPEEFRLVFHTVVVEGMSYREASEIAECSIGTVMSRLHRSREIMRRQLSKLI